MEPENRLVARTLEAVLEDKLTAVRTAENQLAAQQARRPVTLTEEETAWITTAGADLRAIFQAPATTNAQRKELIRAVITEVTVTVQDNTDEGDTARTCQVQIIWQGGASTRLQMPMPASGRHGRVTSEDTLDLIRRLASRYDDTTIAQILGQQNRRTATGLAFRKTHVRALRTYHDIPEYQALPANVTPGCQDATVVSIAEAGRQLGVSSATIYRWLRDGFVTRRATHPGSTLADPHRPGTPRPDPAPGPRRLATPRPGRRPPRRRPPDRVEQGPTRRTHRHLPHPRTPQRAPYPGRTRPGWTL